MADQNQGEFPRFRETDQFETARPHLGDGAGGTFDRIQPHGLDGIDHHERRVLRLLQAGGDVAHVDRGGELDGRIRHPKAPSAQTDLIDGFLAGNVEHALAGTGEAGGGLQQQGGFADARVAADQHDRGWDQTAPQHAVEFGYPDRRPGRRFGAAGQSYEIDRPADRCLGGRARAGGDDFFLDSVPFTAGFAAAGPFRGDGAAGLADETRGGFGQRSDSLDVTEPMIADPG